MELQEQLTALQGELKVYFEKAAEDVKTKGSILEETKTALAKLEEKADALQKQTDAIDAKLRSNGSAYQPEIKSVGQQFVESAQYLQEKSANFRSKAPVSAPVENLFAERKATITTSAGLTSGSTGIQMPMRLGGITGLARQELRIRDLMQVTKMTTGNSFDYVQMLTRTNAASPQVEASAKSESTYAWNSVSGTVKTIAHFTNVSRQALDDVAWLSNMINSELMYGLLLKEEAEILSGDGTGQHLNGLITQATAYNTGLNVSGDTPLDKLRHAKLQARLVGLGTFAPDGIVLNPTDMARIELLKTEEGGANKGLYIIGDPKTGPAIKMVWNLPVVESDSITAGTFLIGAFGTAAEIIDRMAAAVEISYEHASNFTSNLATILCEERLGLAVRRPTAFITGAI